MVVDKLASGCLNHTSAVGSGVVGLAFPESDTLGHCWSWKSIISLDSPTNDLQKAVLAHILSFQHTRPTTA
jgi:hypothetical protein